jgi:serine phosphatase RsbU (regulator of sigma subunit)
MCGTGVLVVVVAYTAVLRGDAVLRRWLLLHFATLLPISIVLAVAPTVDDPNAANAMYRIGISMIPLVAVGGIRYQLALLPSNSGFRWRGRVVVVCGLLLTAWSLLSRDVIDGVMYVGYGWFPSAGTLAWLLAILVVAVAVLGFAPLLRAARVAESSALRRQLRGTLIANLLTTAALSDIRIVYGYGSTRLSWLLIAGGSVLSLRALIVEDVLRARAVDTTLPRTIATWLATAFFGWVLLTLLGEYGSKNHSIGAVPWAVGIVLVAAYCSVRIAMAIVFLILRGGRVRIGPLDRLLQHFVDRAHGLHRHTDIANLGQEVATLGYGAPISIWVASRVDWSWSNSAGKRITDVDQLNPMLINWLIEQDTLIIDGTTVVPDDLRGEYAELLRDTRSVLLIVRGGILYGMLRIPRSASRAAEMSRFAVKLSNHIGDAMQFCDLQKEVDSHVQQQRDIELTATIQASLLPSNQIHHYHGLDVVGAWQPASACGGDFWTVKALTDSRTLLIVADVSGHGIAPAIVTAAVAGACAAVSQTDGETLSVDAVLKRLDAVVRRAGGNELHMTCFAAIIEPNSLEFANAGHTAPYLLTWIDGKAQLQALVGRGNPLGMGGQAAGSAAPATTAWKVQRKQTAPGAYLVAFTDGLTDTQSMIGEPYGDRRLQKLLRSLPAGVSVTSSLRMVTSAVAAHQGQMPLVDDQMLVIARLG